MARRLSRYDYAQSVIGDCGHVCGIWPQITDLAGKNPRIICDECTRVAWSIPENERITVWVRMVEPKRPKKDTPPKKKAKPKPVGRLAQIMEQEGLFDAPQSVGESDTQIPEVTGKQRYNEALARIGKPSPPDPKQVLPGY